jgi:RHS repeat-associated protein
LDGDTISAILEIRTQFKNGTAIGTYNYPTTSNRLTSITGTWAESYGYDAAGNITGLAGKTLTYDARGRLKTLASGTSSWSYGINALGQRVTKSGTGFTGTLPFVYDERGHLIGEYTSTGALTQETVYLGDTPVALLQSSATFYVQADQLDTPRVILNAANQQRWRWDLNEPFGNNTPNENPASLGVFKYNLRFHGQYFDAETGLSQNYFRDYNPKIGRYLQSDPIGLLGGINTYAYGGSAPTIAIDPLGMDIVVVTGGVRETSNPFGHSAMAIQGAGMFSYGNGTPLGSSPLEYIQNQSRIRKQVVTIVPTTPKQDAAALNYFLRHPGMNTVGTIDNCAVRTNEALGAASITTSALPFPGSVAREVMSIPGAQTFYVPKGGDLPQPLLDAIHRFAPAFP